MTAKQEWDWPSERRRSPHEEHQAEETYQKSCKDQ
jgi:hypothetical protein